MTKRKTLKIPEEQVLATLALRPMKLKELFDELKLPSDEHGRAYSDLSALLGKMKKAGKLYLQSPGRDNRWALSGKKQFTIEMDNTLLANEELIVLLQKHNGKVL